MYKVKEALTSLLFTDLIFLLNDNKHSEHDCDRETYINNVITTMYLKPNHRITLLYDNEKPIGYLIVRHDNYITNEIVVLDVYIIKEYQGKNCIDILIDDMIPIAFKVKALRIK